MEKLQDNILMRVRSYRKVLTAGLRLYSDHFLALFKASWLMVLLYNVVCAVLGTLATVKLPAITVTLIGQLAAYGEPEGDALLQYIVNIAEIFGLLVLVFIAYALASATVLGKLKEHQEAGVITKPVKWLSVSPRLMGRTLKGMLLTYVVLLIPLLLVCGIVATLQALSPHLMENHAITFVATLCMLTVAVLLLALPLAYTFMKYMMEAPAGYWRTLAASYGCGLRHWGSMFLVVFLSSMIVAAGSLLVMLPTHILTIASQTAQIGVLRGDPTGMPAYMPALTFCTYLVTCFLQFYVYQILLIHNYYIYGSIEAKEQQKRHHEQYETENIVY